MAARQQQVQGADSQETEKKILEAARRVFHRRGFAGARMQDIADEAGINKALLHYYFRSKQQLFDMVFREALMATLPQIAQVLASDMPIEEKIEQFVHGYIDVLVRHPYIPAFIIHEVNTNPDRLRSLIPLDKFNIPDILSRQLRRAIREGRIRRIPPRQLLVNLVSLCVFPFVARPMIGFALGLQDDEAFEEFIAERKKTLVPFILNALRP